MYSGIFYQSNKAIALRYRCENIRRRKHLKCFIQYKFQNFNPLILLCNIYNSLTFDISCTICFQQHPPPLLSIYLLCWLWQRRKINWIKAFVYTSCSYSDLLSLHQILVFANKRQSICSLILFATVVGRKHKVSFSTVEVAVAQNSKVKHEYRKNISHFNTYRLYNTGCEYQTLAPM